MIEAQFPTAISRGAVTVNDWNTQIHVLPNGNQTRIARQSQTLGRWSIDVELANKTEHKALRNFKLAVKGAAIAFRFKDWTDYESDGQQNCSPAVGNGVTTAFQLQKTYEAPAGGTSYVRTVTKPVASSIEIYKAGVLQTLTTDYTVSSSTGVVIFVVAPGIGESVKAVFEFDKPAHFVNDENQEVIDQDDQDSEGLFHHTGIEIEEVNEI